MELPEIIKKHHELIDVMIDMNQLLRSMNRVILAGIDPTQYAIQFCTVRLNVFRGIGKTQYIVDNVTAKDLIVVKDEQMKQLVVSRLNGKEFNILSASMIKNMGRFSQSFEKIYVDEPIMCFDSRSMFEFYGKFVDGGIQQTFILLGL
jgi:hypothetical protein